MRFPSQFFRYFLAGGVAASLNVISRIVYDWWTTYSVAIVLAHLTGMTTMFLLARRFVFSSGGRSAVGKSAVFFLVVQAIALLQSWAISILLAEHILPALGVQRFSHEIAHVVGVGSALFTNYFGNKYWAFRAVPA